MTSDERGKLQAAKDAVARMDEAKAECAAIADIHGAEFERAYWRKHDAAADAASACIAYVRSIEAERLSASGGEGLQAAAKEIIRRVEGPGCERYAAGNMRLKDTPEWVAFYNAYYDSTKASPPPAAEQGAVAWQVSHMTARNPPNDWTPWSECPKWEHDSIVQNQPKYTRTRPLYAHPPAAALGEEDVQHIFKLALALADVAGKCAVDHVRQGHSRNRKSEYNDACEAILSALRRLAALGRGEGTK